MTPAIHTAETLRVRIDGLKAELRREMSGKCVLTDKARRLQTKIEDLEARLEEALNPTSAPLGSVLPDDPQARARIYRLLVKVPLAADLLYDTLTELQGAVRSLGLQEVTITQKVSAVRSEVEQLVFMIDNHEWRELQKVLSDDDTMISHLQLLLDRYMDSKMPGIITAEEGGEA